MLKNNWILPLGSFLAGVTLGLVWQTVRIEAPPTTDAAEIAFTNLAKDASSALADDLAELQVIVDFQEAELQRLRADLRDARLAVAARPAPPLPETAEAQSPQPEAPARNRWVERMDARADARAGELAEALGLTAAQREALAGAFRSQMEAFRSRRDGAEAGFDLDGAIEGILTPDQFAAYIERSQEEIYNRAELMATTQTVRLGQTVPMAPEQQSQVYDILHLTAQEALISREVGDAFDFRQTALERLRSVLDPEQLRVVEETGLRRWGGGP